MQDVFSKCEVLTYTYVISAAEGLELTALRLKAHRPAAELFPSAIMLFVFMQVY